MIQNKITKFQQIVLSSFLFHSPRLEKEKEKKRKMCTNEKSVVPELLEGCVTLPNYNAFLPPSFIYSLIIRSFTFVLYQRTDF